MEPTPAGDLEGLLREQAWLRAFVQRLVARDDADDVVQQTWLAALLRPVSPRDPRAWLSALAANLARLLHRSELRRRRRERARSDDAHVPPTADTVAKLELLQRVAAAVCALPEPLRSALVLHYHDGMTPDAIATRLGLAPAAVRKRLQRGRDQVRTALARELGDGWRSLGCVIAFTSGRRAVCTARRAALLSTAALAVAGVSFGCLALGGASNAALAAASAASGSTAAHGERATRTESTVAEVAPQHAERERLEPQGAERSKPAVTPFVGVRLRGRCVADETGAPLASVKATARCVLPVSYPQAGSITPPPPQTTGADGTFEFALAIPAGRVHLWLESAGRVGLNDDYEAPRERTTDLGDVRMRRGYPLRGRVIDERSQPVPELRLEVPVDVGINSANGRLHIPTSTDAAGRFEFQCLPPGRVELSSDSRKGVRLVAKDFEVLPQLSGTEIEVRVVTSQSISGVVFDEAGRPAADAVVSVVDPRTSTPSNPDARSGADGSFELYRDENCADEVCLVTGQLGTPFEPTAQPQPFAWNAHGVRLRAVVAPAIEINVRDEDGRPVPDFALQQTWKHDGVICQTGSGSQPCRHADGFFRGYAVRRGTAGFTLVPKDASLRVGELWFPGDQLPVTTVELRLARLLPFAVTVADATGKPVAGIDVDVLDMRGTADPNIFDDWRTGRQVVGMSAALRLATGQTDADGNVALAAPRSCRDLLLVVRTKPPLTQPLTKLPEDGQPLCIALPQR